jgi:hypothetical protein
MFSMTKSHDFLPVNIVVDYCSMKPDFAAKSAFSGAETYKTPLIS